MHHNLFPVEQGGPGGPPSKWHVVDFEVLEDFLYLVCIDARGAAQVIGVRTTQFQVVNRPDQKNRILARAQSREKIRRQSEAAGPTERAARGMPQKVEEPTTEAQFYSPVKVNVNLDPKTPEDLEKVLEWLKTAYSDRKSSSESSSEGMSVADLQDFNLGQTQDGYQEPPSQEGEPRPESK
jgi:hypothetical protein